MNRYLIFGLLLVAVVILAYVKGCTDGQAKHETITVRDTIRIKPDTVSLTATRFVVHSLNTTDTVRDTTILRRIDTLFREGAVESLRACADTVTQGDTVNVCYEYVTRHFDFSIHFAPRAHDSLITLSGEHGSGKQGKFFSWNSVVGADWEPSRNWFVGVGAEVNIMATLTFGGLVGMDVNGLAARGNVRMKL